MTIRLDRYARSLGLTLSPPRPPSPGAASGDAPAGTRFVRLPRGIWRSSARPIARPARRHGRAPRLQSRPGRRVACACPPRLNTQCCRRLSGEAPRCGRTAGAAAVSRRRCSCRAGRVRTTCAGARRAYAAHSLAGCLRAVCAPQCVALPTPGLAPASRHALHTRACLSVDVTRRRRAAQRRSLCSFRVLTRPCCVHLLPLSTLAFTASSTRQHQLRVRATASRCGRRSQRLQAGPLPPLSLGLLLPLPRAAPRGTRGRLSPLQLRLTPAPLSPPSQASPGPQQLQPPLQSSWRSAASARPPGRRAAPPCPGSTRT